MRLRTVNLALFAMLATLALPANAFAHGGATTGGMSDAAQIKQLALQPTRVLAQQAHALIHINGDRSGAAVRLDAALESKDQRDVDMPALRRATETLDGGGSSKRVLAQIDEALSKPFGANSGKLFHGAGREFRPVAGTQETVAVIAGALMLLLAAVGLRRARRHPA